MKNIVLMVILLISINVLVVFVVDNMLSTDQDVAVDMVQARMKQIQIESNTYQEGVKDGSQREVTTDLLPPLDTNDAGKGILSYLKTGIELNMGLLDDYADNEMEKQAISILQWIISIANICMLAWLFVLLYAKVVHT